MPSCRFLSRAGSGCFELDADGSPRAFDKGGAELKNGGLYPAVNGVCRNWEWVGVAVAGGILRKMLGVCRYPGLSRPTASRAARSPAGPRGESGQLGAAFLRSRRMPIEVGDDMTRGDIGKVATA